MPTAESHARRDRRRAQEARDEAEAAEAEAERAKADAMKKKQEEEEMEMKKKAGKRADLLTLINPLLPDGLEKRDEMSNHALLVAAVGDEVSDAANRSEDYLLAKVEAIAERRARSREEQPAAGQPAQRWRTAGRRAGARST